MVASFVRFGVLAGGLLGCFADYQVLGRFFDSACTQQFYKSQFALPTCTQLSATTSGVEYCQDPSTQANSYWANSATCSGPPTNSTFTPNTFTSCQQDPTFAGGAFPSYARQTCVLSASPYTPWVPPGQAYVSTTSYTNVTTDLEQCGVTPLPSEIVYIDTACGTNNAQSVKTFCNATHSVAQFWYSSSICAGAVSVTQVEPLGCSAIGSSGYALTACYAATTGTPVSTPSTTSSLTFGATPSSTAVSPTASRTSGAIATTTSVGAQVLAAVCVIALAMRA